MKFRTGAISWPDEVTGRKILSGKYFKFLFLKNSIGSMGSENYELIIEANSEVRAQQAFELFISALALIDGHVIFPITEIPSLLLYSKGRIDMGRATPWGVNFRSFAKPGIYDAAVISVKASFRKIHVYSLSKYLFACSQHSNYIIDLDPNHTEYQKLTKKPLDHLRYSYAIYALYSVIEELGLEIRASKENPTRLNGMWNPKIKNDLENRLKKSNVNLDKQAIWNLRSRPTKVHLNDKLRLLGKASWSRYSIRDSKIEIIDALSYTSWLRSKIIAHKLKDSFLSISIYDVANVNFLVRQILLDVLQYQGRRDSS